MIDFFLHAQRARTLALDFDSLFMAALPRNSPKSLLVYYP